MSATDSKVLIVIFQNAVIRTHKDISKSVLLKLLFGVNHSFFVVDFVLKNYVYMDVVAGQEEHLKFQFPFSLKNSKFHLLVRWKNHHQKFSNVLYDLWWGKNRTGSDLSPRLALLMCFRLQKNTNEYHNFKRVSVMVLPLRIWRICI